MNALGPHMSNLEEQTHQDMNEMKRLDQTLRTMNSNTQNNPPLNQNVKTMQGKDLKFL